MTQWRVQKLWQRNVIGAVVAVAAVVVVTIFTLKPAWDDYRRTVVPAHVAAVGQSVTVDGQVWSVRKAGRSTKQPGSGVPVPAGTVLMNVVVERSGPASGGFGCVGLLTDGERSWRATGPPCGAAETMPWSFLIPAGAEPTAVDVTKLDGSILIRLLL